MNPVNPAEQNPQPTQPVTPQPQPQPQPQPAAPVTNVLPESAPVMTAPQPAYSITPLVPHKTNVLRNVLIGFFALSLVIILLFILILPGLQSRAAARNFLEAVRSKDYNTAASLSGESANDSEFKAFIDGSSENVGTGQTEIDSDVKDGKRSQVFEVDNGKSKFARVITEKKGSWMIVDFTTSNSKLAAFPSGKTAIQDETKPSDQPAQQVACLTDADVAPINDGQTYGINAFDDTSRTYIGDTYFFKADSTAYQFETLLQTDLEEISTFYKNNSSKEYKFTLTGKVQDASPTSSGVQLANARAEKIITDLNNLGVPRERFEVLAPKNSATYSDGSERNVDLRIVTKLPCGTSSGL